MYAAMVNALKKIMPYFIFLFIIVCTNTPNSIKTDADKNKIFSSMYLNNKEPAGKLELIPRIIPISDFSAKEIIQKSNPISWYVKGLRGVHIEDSETGKKFYKIFGFGSTVVKSDYIHLLDKEKKLVFVEVYDSGGHSYYAIVDMNANKVIHEQETPGCLVLPLEGNLLVHESKTKKWFLRDYTFAQKFENDLTRMLTNKKIQYIHYKNIDEKSRSILCSSEYKDMNENGILINISWKKDFKNAKAIPLVSAFEGKKHYSDQFQFAQSGEWAAWEYSNSVQKNESIYTIYSELYFFLRIEGEIYDTPFYGGVIVKRESGRGADTDIISEFLTHKDYGECFAVYNCTWLKGSRSVLLYTRDDLKKAYKANKEQAVAKKLALQKSSYSVNIEISGAKEITFYPPAPVYQYKVSPDGHFVAIEDWEFRISVYPIVNGAVSAVPCSRFLPYGDKVKGIYFSPDSNTILTTALNSAGIVSWNRFGALNAKIDSGQVSDIHCYTNNVFVFAEGERQIKIRSIYGKIICDYFIPFDDDVYKPLCVTASASGSRIIAGTSGGWIYFIDTKTGKFSRKDYKTSDITQVCLSPSDDYFAFNVPFKKTVYVCNLNGRIIRNISPAVFNLTKESWQKEIDKSPAGNCSRMIYTPEKEISLMTSSHKGDFLVYVNQDNDICFMPDNFSTIIYSKYHSDEVNAIAVSPDDSLVATGGKDMKICLWDRNGRLTGTFFGCTNPVENIAFSKDGKEIIASSSGQIISFDRNGSILRENRFDFYGNQGSGNSGSVYLYHKKGSYPELKNLQGNTLNKFKDYKLKGEYIITDQWAYEVTRYSVTDNSFVNNAVFSQDDKYIALIKDDTNIDFCETNHKILFSIATNNARYNKAVFSPDGRYAACNIYRGKYAGDGIVGLEQVLVIDLQTKKNVLLLNENPGFDFSGNSESLFTYNDGIIKQWDLKEIFKGKTRIINCSGQKGITRDYRLSFKDFYADNEFKIDAAAFMPGKLIIHGSSWRDFSEYSPATLKYNKSFNSNFHDNLDSSPDNKWISVSDKDKIAVWDSQKRSLLWEKSINKDRISKSAFSADSRLLALYQYDTYDWGKGRIARFVDVQTGAVKLEAKKRYQGHADTVRFSNDSKMLCISSSENPIVFISAETGEEIWTASMKNCNVFDIAFSPDNKCFAAAVRNYNTHIRKILIYDINTKKVLWEFTNLRSDIQCLMFSADNKYLFEGDESSIRIRDLATKKIMYTIAGFDGHPKKMGFSGSEYFCLLTSEDHLYVYNWKDIAGFLK
ncbi:MAG: hypothetical protein V1874_07885 [Spirochaetota bacterium]